MKTPEQIAAEMVTGPTQGEEPEPGGLWFAYLTEPEEHMDPDGEDVSLQCDDQKSDVEIRVEHARNIIARLVARLRAESAEGIARLREALEVMAAKDASAQPEWAAQHVLFEAREAAGIPNGVSIIETVKAWRREREEANALILSRGEAETILFGSSLIRKSSNGEALLARLKTFVGEQGDDPFFVHEANAHPTMKGLAGGGVRSDG
jgi:hypothetical protein